MGKKSELSVEQRTQLMLRMLNKEEPLRGILFDAPPALRAARAPHP